MVDLRKIREKRYGPKITDPIEIFHRLPKPAEIKDLYTSQSEVLNTWYQRRNESDIVIKLHTGGGKTLVGLLIAQSILIEMEQPVLYLVTTKQLIAQTLENANQLNIKAISYNKGQGELCKDFVNSKAVMVGTYECLFNGQSKFGLLNSNQTQTVGAIILDDAHSAFSVIRRCFTLEIKVNEKPDLYRKISDLFRNSFKEIEKIALYEDIISGEDYGVEEIPYYSWYSQLDVIREYLRAEKEESKIKYIWPLIRDNLHLCHALITRDSFTITPYLPLVNMFPTFTSAPRKIYMSATISDDSDLIRTFDATPESVTKTINSHSLAGVSERMILIPELMRFGFNIKEKIIEFLGKISSKPIGKIILVPSKDAAKKWEKVATIANAENLEQLISDLQKKINFGPIVFANRYDGIDLPGDSCRLLIFNGLPMGSSAYEKFRAKIFSSGVSLNKMLAQRIEQGMGRGSRGAGDFCVILIMGKDISRWTSIESNFNYFTNPTKVQVKIGQEVSEDIENLQDFFDIMQRCFSREQEWVTFHAEELADQMESIAPETNQTLIAEIERKAFNHFNEGNYDWAISTIEKKIEKNEIDSISRGWLEQLAAVIANKKEDMVLAEKFQTSAFLHNNKLLRPKKLPVYSPLTIPGEQAKSIIKKIETYSSSSRRGIILDIEDIGSRLTPTSSTGNFEESLKNLASFIGFTAERHDEQGVGPDVLWIISNKIGLIIEAKSHKKTKNPFNKEEHGQLLVAGEWFKKHYPEHEGIRVSVHPLNTATKAAIAEASHALTFEKLAILVSDIKAFLQPLLNLHVTQEQLLHYCETNLSKTHLTSDKFVEHYLIPFESSS